MSETDFRRQKADEWLRKGDSDLRIEPRYPADIPIYYSVEETKTAIKLAEEIIRFIKKAI